MENYNCFQSKEWWIITVLYAIAVFTAAVIHSLNHWPLWIYWVSLVILIVVYWVFAFTIPINAWNRKQLEQYKQQQNEKLNEN